MEEHSKQFQDDVDRHDTTMVSHVWYAAYGSNINYSRFLDYIDNCTDTEAPSIMQPITIPFDIYFASHSRKWNRKGVAFLDDTHEGRSFGRMYLVTMGQFLDIQRQEGRKYSKKLMLGTKEGLPIYTFTAPEKRNDIEAPDVTYFDTILKGLKETYPDTSVLILEQYLFMHGILQDDDKRVLSFIRNSAHGVSLSTIAENTVPITRVERSVMKLISYQLIKFDSRNPNNGRMTGASSSVVYTRSPRRELIDLILMD